MSRTFTVALVGADGAGKSTIAQSLPEHLPFPSTYLYMGVASASSNHALPTTRLAHAVRRSLGRVEDHGPPDADRATGAGSSGGRGLPGEVRAILRLANRLAEEWYRQGLVWSARARGRVVVFDRHFYLDYHAHHIAPVGGPPRRWTDRLHGRLLSRAYPRPDLVIHLDAPPEVLLARKGEGTLESLARRQAEYVALAPDFADFIVVDASRPLELVRAEVVERIVEYARRRGVRPVTPGAGR
jgi:thymidylate kinase